MPDSYEKDLHPIYVAGHNGLVGSAIVRKLTSLGMGPILTRSRSELDLRDPHQVDSFFAAEYPKLVYMAAGIVGGINANMQYPADFIRDNLMMVTNIVHACSLYGAYKLLYLGSSCIYPKNAAQPIHESYMMTGMLEPTNEPYAMSKLAGLSTVRAYRKQNGLNGICLIPTNLYGPGDSFDLRNSHLVPALMSKMHTAKLAGDKSVEIWGTGKPMRELMHVDDLADACVHFMNTYNGEGIVNVGTGIDLTIRQIAEEIAAVVGFTGELVFDPGWPDGIERKLLDVNRAKELGWSSKIPLREGLMQAYDWYVKNVA